MGQTTIVLAILKDCCLEGLFPFCDGLFLGLLVGFCVFFYVGVELQILLLKLGEL